MGIAGHRGGLSPWACPPPGIGNGCKQGGVGGDGAGRSQPAPRKVQPPQALRAASQPPGLGLGPGRVPTEPPCQTRAPGRSCSQVGRRRNLEARAAHLRAAAGIYPPGFHGERRRGRGGPPRGDPRPVRGGGHSAREGAAGSRRGGSWATPRNPGGRATPIPRLLRFLLGRRSQRAARARRPRDGARSLPGGAAGAGAGIA